MVASATYAYLAVEFDHSTEIGFIALVIAAVTSPFVSLAIAYRLGMRAAILWSVGFLLIAGVLYLLMVGASIHDGDTTSSLIVSAIALVFVPNLLFALLGRGLFAVLRRGGTDA